MTTLHEKSRATMQFTLQWNDGQIQHNDQLWTDQINMWRDLFPGELQPMLVGAKEGDTIQTAFLDEHTPIVHQPERKVWVPSSKFYRPGFAGNPLTPLPGRFYPQGFLHGIDNVFTTSLGPARCLETAEDKFLFSLNHPLAGHDLNLTVEILSIHEDSVERGGRCEDWFEKCVENGPGMQARYPDLETSFFTNGSLTVSDTSADHLFYSEPRLVQHLDSTARETISKQYATLIAPGSRVLDLMASWDSHLPHSHKLKELALLGMNETEMEANAHATSSVVHDLNHNPTLPFAENSFDAIISTASIEYLTDPLAIFAEAHRVLVPGGVFAIAFSNRWFPTKAIAVWPLLHEYERLGLVAELFYKTPGFATLETMTNRGQPRPEDDRHQDIAESDPVFMIWGTKTAH